MVVGFYKIYLENKTLYPLFLSAVHQLICNQITLGFVDNILHYAPFILLASVLAKIL